MKQYEFETIAVSRNKEGMRLAADYRDVILARAAKGWSFVQAINLENQTDARIELVFAKEEV